VKRLLLDTHALLWWLSDDAQLGAETRRAISNPRNQVYVSAASTWEISIKKTIGKLSAPDDIVDSTGAGRGADYHNER